MSNEAAFLKTIEASPHEAGPKHVYADWLEERGDCAHAEKQRALAGVDELAATLVRIFPQVGNVEKSQLAINAAGDLIEVSYGQMYEAPDVKIDADNYSHGGCDSCDWGSNYGHTFQVRAATKNVEAAKMLAERKSIYPA